MRKLFESFGLSIADERIGGRHRIFTLRNKYGAEMQFPVSLGSGGFGKCRKLLNVRASLKKFTTQKNLA